MLSIYAKEKKLVAVLIDLAIAGERRPVTLKALAKRNSVTVNYLEKIFGLLRKNNLIQCVLGKRGGYQMGSRGLEISIFEILVATAEHGKKDSDTEYSDEVAKMTNELWNIAEEFSLEQFKGLTLRDFLETIKVQEIEQDSCN